MIRKLFFTSMIGLVFMGKAVGVGAISENNQIENNGNIQFMEYEKKIAVNGVNRSNISKVEAMAIAEKEEKGKVMDAVFHPEEEFYQIGFTKLGHNVVIKVDSHNGKILEKKIL
ncbi:PepSY domain-containing protein [Bacillus sp. FJAT-29790]|uniref:PepSY domain-containing protein n=1 Tax=Bacillus sp. FJAT-29790 TaxID=1895002 RepID=UPI001C229CF4|nr:PepSY domain-containing protein [Bacillus sp. FJAT-29790]MBU8878880.1 PepSY domain-containing protein [Bacillus sp. FJAT-29790]